MHIVMAAIGTRGDVQPFVAIGKELLVRGHAVSFATTADHRELIEPQGLAHRPVCGNFRDLMGSPVGKRWVESGSPLEVLKGFRELFAPVAAEWLSDLDGALRDADAVLAHYTATGAIAVARGRGLRYVVGALGGAIPSRKSPMGVGPSILNRWAHGHLLDQIWKVGERDAAAYLRSRHVDVPRGPFWREQVKRGIPHLHLFSEHVFPFPSDWPACTEIVGYCFLDAPPTWQPPPKLVDFLSAGPQPVYVGFGSMTGMRPEELAALTRDALRRAKVRAVIAAGWGGMRGIDGSDDMFVVDDVPHDWLFPRVAAVVQHCGAGTVAAALRAGRPIVAVPFFADQPIWASIIRGLGVAPAPVPKRKLTARRLADAITEVLTNARYASRAARLGELIRAERGASRAAERVLDHFGVG